MLPMRRPSRLLAAMLLLTLPLVPAGPATATATETAAADSSDSTSPDQAVPEYGRMLLVLDSSGSMQEPAGGGQSKIEAARTALERVVDGLPDEVDVGLRVFGAEVFSRDQPGACTDSQLVVPPGTDNREELRAAVADYEPYGETPIAHALEEAAGDIGGEGARSIVLVSDGVATCEPDPCEVAGRIAAQGIDLRVDVVGLSVDARTRQQLSCIADAGRGAYYDADSAEDIVEQLEIVATRAVRPFEVDGTPIEGGTELDPTPVGAGRWADTLAQGDSGEDAVRWYRYERTIPGSTLHVGASSLGGRSRDALRVEIKDESGSACTVGTFSAKLLVSSALVVAGTASGPDSSRINADCLDAEALLVEVARGEGTFAGDGEAPFSLELVEEPPVEDVEALPEPVEGLPAIEIPTTPGEPEPTRGGSSFGTATPLEPGAFAGSIVAGETQVWRVPVDWGQSMSARVVLPETTGAAGEAFGARGPFASVAVHNPVRATVVTRGDTQTTGFSSSAGTTQISGGTGEVRYLNRAERNNANLAGDYYVEYAVDEDDRGEGLELPFRLEIAVEGEVSGVPEYVEAGGPVTGTAPEDEAGTEADTEAAPESAPQATGADGDGGVPLLLLAAVALGVLAVAGVTAGVLLLRRPRG